MSLPGTLGIALADVGVPVPYLRADGKRLDEAARATSCSDMKVGLAWAGAPDNTNDFRRSIALNWLAPLFDVSGVRFFSLKREGEALAPDYARLSERLVGTPLRNDFDGLAALVASLDLVISVDTSLVHLAGALGKPVWVLLPFARIGGGSPTATTAPWYPSVTLFRQRAAGDWSHPIMSVAAALQERSQRGDR